MTAADDCARSRIKGWASGNIHLELHDGVPAVFPPHTHDAYQIGFISRHPCSFLSHGRKFSAPPGSLLLFHPGEVHETSERSVRGATPGRLMFLDPETVCAVAADVSGRKADLPFFRDNVIVDRDVANAFRNVHQLFEVPSSELERDSALRAFIVQIVMRYAATPCAIRAKSDPSCAKRVRDFIDAHYEANLSLAQLARIAQVSPFHLVRMFRREVGISPHAYQIQLRIVKAKSLLVHGWSVTATAMHTGFFDQSHFTRHFRRLVGVSPGSYAVTH